MAWDRRDHLFSPKKYQVYWPDDVLNVFPHGISGRDILRMCSQVYICIKWKKDLLVRKRSFGRQRLGPRWYDFVPMAGNVLIVHLISFVGRHGQEQLMSVSMFVPTVKSHQIRNKTQHVQPQDHVVIHRDILPCWSLSLEFGGLRTTLIHLFWKPLPLAAAPYRDVVNGYYYAIDQSVPSIPESRVLK